MSAYQLEHVEKLPTKLRERIKAFSLLDFNYVVRDYTGCTEISIEKKDTKEKIYDVSM